MAWLMWPPMFLKMDKKDENPKVRQCPRCKRESLHHGFNGVGWKWWCCECGYRETAQREDGHE